MGHGAGDSNVNPASPLRRATRKIRLRSCSCRQSLIHSRRRWGSRRSSPRSRSAADEQLRTHRGRYADHRIDEAISAWTREHSKHDAMHALQRAGVPAGAVQHAKDLHHDPQVRALEYFRAAWGSELGLRVWPGTWYGMQATPGDIRRGTSTFGEDNVRVLRDLLGYSDDKVRALLATEAFSELQDGMERPATPGVSVATMLEQGTILSWDD